MLETEFVPAKEAGSLYLMVVLHGLGDSMEGYRWLPEMLQLPWLNYLLVNAPDPYYGGFSWYDFVKEPGPGVKRSRESLFHVLDEQIKAGYASGKTVVFGFSQGCLMTLEVGLRYPHLLAGLVGISGYSHEPEKGILELSPVAREQKFLITNGSRDPLIPMKAVREQINLLKSAGLQIDWHEFNKDHTIAGEEEIKLVRSFVKSCCGKS